MKAMKPFALSACLMLVLLSIAFSAAAKGVTIRYGYLPAGVALHKAEKAWIEKFEERHPDVKVKMVALQSYNKLLVHVAAGVAPDVFFFEDEPFMMWAKKGALENLDPYLEKDPLEDREDFFSLPFRMAQYNGHQYALPVIASPIAIFYNKTPFDEVGVPYPTEDWTLADWTEAWKKLTVDKNGDGRIDQYGMVMATGTLFFLPFLWSYGGALLAPLPYEEGKTQCVLNTPEAIEALQWWQDLFNRYKIAVPMGHQDIVGSTQGFASGKVACFLSNPWELQQLRPAAKANPDLHWDIAPVPTGPKGLKVTRFTFNTMAMNPRSKHKQAAWAFLKSYLSKEAQMHFTRAGRSMPVRKSIAKSDVFLRPDTPQHEELFVEAMEKYIRCEPYSPYWDEMSQAIAPQLQLMLLKKITPKECVERIVPKVNKILAQDQ